MNKRSEIKGSYFRYFNQEEKPRKRKLKEAEVDKDSNWVVIFSNSCKQAVTLQPFKYRSKRNLVLLFWVFVASWRILIIYFNFSYWLIMCSSLSSSTFLSLSVLFFFFLTQFRSSEMKFLVLATLWQMILCLTLTLLSSQKYFDNLMR